MFAFITFVIAVYAWIKVIDLSEKVQRLEKDREYLTQRLGSLQLQADGLLKERSAAPVASQWLKPPPAEAAQRPSQSDLPLVPKPVPPEPQKAAAARPDAQPVAPKPIPAPPSVPEPPAAPIDWESLVGVKGAAWVGGIALITSAIFFARWTIEQGLVTPELRFMLMLFAGAGSLVAAGLFYLILPVVSKDEDNNRVLITGALGGIAPFLFVMVLASSPTYVEQWPLLFGMVALIDLAILVMAVLRGRVGLLISAAVATSLTLALWAGKGLKPGKARAGSSADTRRHHHCLNLRHGAVGGRSLL